ncbi:Wide host range VirA protein [anaerobic digester metagenome]|uniref:Wide host range VirA protein n=1 Tax=anaerobic digester metagenome TaxID=1263854 RepID=A0A485LYA6_9ZZZZ
MKRKKEKAVFQRDLQMQGPPYALFTCIGQCMVDPCLVLDAQGAVAAWNDALADLTGIPGQDMLGKSDREYALPFYGSRAPLLVDYVLWPELLRDVPVSNILKEGPVLSRNESFPEIRGSRIFHTRAAALTGDQGEVLGAIQSFHEITGPETDRDALPAINEKYRTFFQNSADFLFIHDLSGNMIETNIASRMHTGYTSEEIIHKNIKDLMPEQYRPLFDRYLKKIVRSGGGEGIISIQTKDGRERVIEYRNTLIRDSRGNPLYVQGSGRDITGRIKGEIALKISEEKYRNILDSIEEGYFEVDLAGNFTFFNQALPKNLNYTSEELMGMNYRKYVDEENAKKIYEAFHQVFMTGKPAKAFDWEIRDKNGRRLFVEASVSLLRNSRQTPIGFRGIVRDITQRKEADRERDRYEMRLSQAQKMEVIGTLASGIAHDFNNMLSAIMGYTELARNQLPSGSPVERSLGQVVKAGMRARDLVAQLLSLGKSYRLDRETMKVDTIIREAVNLMRATIPSSIEIRTDLHPEAGLVYADPTEIHQLVMNLCTNAYQAMEDRGGLIQVSLRPVSLRNDEIKGKINPPLQEGEYLAITVADTGCGMDEHTMQHIFDPFFTTKDRSKGTGLGLATVSRIIADLKGGISVESRLHEGSTFTLYLPRYPGKAKKPKQK